MQYPAETSYGIQPQSPTSHELSNFSSRKALFTNRLNNHEWTLDLQINNKRPICHHQSLSLPIIEADRQGIGSSSSAFGTLLKGTALITMTQPRMLTWEVHEDILFRFDACLDSDMLVYQLLAITGATDPVPASLILAVPPLRVYGR